MQYPTVSSPELSRVMVTAFAGLHHVPQCAGGEWYDDLNLTSAGYPVLTQRPPRFPGPDTGSACGIFAKESLGWVDGQGRLVYGGQVTGLTLDPGTDKQFVSMGAKLVVFPDKKYLNTADLSDFGSLEAVSVSKIRVTYLLCDENGNDYVAYHVQDKAPASPAAGALWIDTSVSPHQLKQYSGDEGLWTALPATYVRIHSEGLGLGFAPGDGVTLSGCRANEQDSLLAEQIEALNGSHVIAARADDWIAVPGIVDSNIIAAAAVTVRRSVPDLDFVVEAQNRLWGCRYGSAGGQTVNELYCSKLGDPANWQVYQGLSTDSWTAGVGSDGPFTGAAVHGGCPLFFKEDTLHKIYIAPGGGHQIVTQSCRGVQKGCQRSLCTVDEVLYYKSRAGFCAYSGALPAGISEALGDLTLGEVRAGGHGSRYVCSGTDGAGQPASFVYDTVRGLWHRESPMEAVCYARLEDTLYWQDGEGRLNCSPLAGASPPEGWPEGETEEVCWQCQSGIIGFETPDSKRLARFRLRLNPEPGSSVTLFLQYDSEGVWENKGTLASPGLHSVTVPVLPRRCDHLQLKLEGRGPCKLYSIAYIYEQGSDV